MKFKKLDVNWPVLCAAAVLFFLLGVRDNYSFHSASDFVPVYAGARCLLHGCNPYDTSQLEQQYYQAGGLSAELPEWKNTPPVYPPSTLLVLSPAALLPFPMARLLWFLVNGCLFVIAAGLILSLCPRSHRWFALALVVLILAASGTLLALGNPGIFAISLLIIGSYLFIRTRFVPLAAILLMLSLAAKPQMGVFIVLYFIVARIHWRYAVAAAAGSLAILLFAGLILSHHPRSANWISDLHTKIVTTEQAGNVNDPRPANRQAIADLNLQPITSVFFPEERVFNTFAYAIFLVLLAVWVAAFLRTNASLEMHLLSLAALSVLTLLPVYHRFYDSRLLLIGIPAVAIIYERRRILGTFIGVLIFTAVFSAQSRLQGYLFHHAMWQRIEQHKVLFILLLRQQNMELPLMFCIFMFAIFTIRFPTALEEKTVNSTA